MKLHESAKDVLSEATYGQARVLMMAWKRATSADLEDFFAELSSEYNDMAAEGTHSRLDKEQCERLGELFYEAAGIFGDAAYPRK